MPGSHKIRTCAPTPVATPSPSSYNILYGGAQDPASLQLLRELDQAVQLALIKSAAMVTTRSQDSRRQSSLPATSSPPPPQSPSASSKSQSLVQRTSRRNKRRHESEGEDGGEGDEAVEDVRRKRRVGEMGGHSDHGEDGEGKADDDDDDDDDDGGDGLQSDLGKGARRKHVKFSDADEGAPQQTVAVVVTAKAASNGRKTLQETNHDREYGDQMETEREVGHQEANVEVDKGDKDEDDEDDDEAPETVSAATGLDTARKTAAKIQETIQKTEAKDRQKRKDRNARLQAQADANKAKSEASKAALVHDDMDADESSTSKPTVHLDEDATRKREERSPFSDRLPDKVLLSEPMVIEPRVSSKPQNSQSKVTGKHKKFLNEDTKPPKDLRQGRKKIRVLPSQHRFLPPKPNANSKAIREAWLLGRRGPRGEFTMMRKKMGGGFLVKQ